MQMQKRGAAAAATAAESVDCCVVVHITFFIKECEDGATRTTPRLIPTRAQIKHEKREGEKNAPSGREKEV